MPRSVRLAILAVIAGSAFVMSAHVAIADAMRASEPGGITWRPGVPVHLVGGTGGAGTATSSAGGAGGSITITAGAWTGGGAGGVASGDDGDADEADAFDDHPCREPAPTPTPAVFSASTADVVLGGASNTVRYHGGEVATLYDLDAATLSSGLAGFGGSACGVGLMLMAAGLVRRARERAWAAAQDRSPDGGPYRGANNSGPR
jgi:hypothetical protein